MKNLNILYHRYTREMKIVNPTALPISEVGKRTLIKLRTWIGQTNFVIFKLKNFDIVLGMNFLFEHKIIPMPRNEILSSNEVQLTIIQTNTKQPEGVKMMSSIQSRRSLTDDEPTLGLSPSREKDHKIKSVLVARLHTTEMCCYSN